MQTLHGRSALLGSRGQQTFGRLSMKAVIKSPIFNVSIIFICALYVSISGVRNPYYNWDIIGYSAAAFKSDGFHGEPLQEAVFSHDLKEQAGTKKFNSLIGSQPPDHYRHTVYADPASLEEQIPLYSIRELYIWAMKLVHLWGPSYFSATYMVSAFFAGLSVVALSLIISHQRLPQLFLPVVVYFSGLVGIARFSTPDSLACFISLLLIISLLRKSYYSLFL